MLRIALLALLSLPLLAQDVLLRGQPTAEELAALAKERVAVVINLRTPEEMAKLGLDEKSIAEQAGQRYIAVPFPNATPPSDDALEPVFAALAAASDERRVLLHCASGNRVGWVWGLYRFRRQGVTPEKAIEEARAAGMKPALEPSLRERLK